MTRALDSAVEFDHPFRVADGGLLSDEDVSGVHGPDVENDGPEDMLVDGVPYRQSTRWEALTGYTGQHAYNGPVMHSSEFLGGGLARDILATPGVYVVTSVEVRDCDEYCPDWHAGQVHPDHEPAGWAILRLREEVPTDAT